MASMTNEPTIVEKEEVYLLGMVGQEGMESEGEFLSEYVLHKLFFPNMKKLEEYRQGDGLYGIPHQGYMFAVPTGITGVPEDAPEGAEWRTTPAGRYAVFNTTARALGNKANEMVRTWFSEQQEYERKVDAFEIEYYPPECKGADSQMEVWIPVEKR